MRPTTTTVTAGVDLGGKVALVTGASSGIGRECARILALRGARVLMACRNEAKAEAVIRAFVTAIGGEAAGRCELRVCDTASVASVSRLASAIVAERRGVDLVFLNAGVFNLPYQLTGDGLEYTYAANYVGHFLLVHALAGGGCLAPRCRIVATLSAGAYRDPWAKADLEMLTVPALPHNARRFSRVHASPNTKVLLALMMLEFCRRVVGTSAESVTFNCGAPGPTTTGYLDRMRPSLRPFARGLAALLAHDVEVGAAVLMWLAVAKEHGHRCGGVFNARFTEVMLPARVADPTLAREAWDATERILRLPPFSPAGRALR